MTPEDVNDVYSITQAGEAQRQNTLGMAGDIITGQAQLDEMRNKVPVSVGGRTFNVSPVEAARIEMDNRAFDQTLRQHGFENTLGALEFMRKNASDAKTAEMIDARIDYLKTLQDKYRHDMEKTTSGLGMDLDDLIKTGKLESAINEGINSGNVNQSHVRTFNTFANSPYAYLNFGSKGIFSPNEGVKQVPLPKLDGVQITSSILADYARKLGGLSHEEAYMHLMGMVDSDNPYIVKDNKLVEDGGEGFGSDDYMNLFNQF